jgi:hypothetical protein
MPTPDEQQAVHLDHAREDAEQWAMLADVATTLGQESALLHHPQLQAAFRGSRIDQFAKDTILQHADLAEVITAPDFIAEPDITDSVLPDWFDLTTRAQWTAHLRRYAARCGRLYCIARRTASVVVALP